jgi:hypothetical protein
MERPTRQHEEIVPSILRGPRIGGNGDEESLGGRGRSPEGLPRLVEGATGGEPRRVAWSFPPLGSLEQVCPRN